jgi:hypothetical protein
MKKTFLISIFISLIFSSCTTSCSTGDDVDVNQKNGIEITID